MENWTVGIEDFHKTTHVGAFVMMRKVHSQLDGGDRILTGFVKFIPNFNWVAEFFYSHAVDSDLAIIRLALRIMQERRLGTHGETLRPRTVFRNRKISSQASDFVIRWLLMSSIFNLQEEVAVVIGGTGALGSAMASALSAAGARVALAGRNTERGTALAESISQSGGETRFFSVDAPDLQSVRSLLESVQSKWTVPSILVNAAGGNSPTVTVTSDLPFEIIQKEDWLENFELNLIGGALVPCQVFGPAMAEAGGGSIINIASVSAHLPLSRVIAYSAAKAAVLNLTAFLAREWAPKGVRVNSITPGFFPAEQNRNLLFQDDGSPTERGASILGHTPMARFGEPQELGGAVVFLASKQASGFVTGTDLRVDGGFLSQTI